ncbi:MAG: TonB-dependent receptor, partial [Acidobacteriota bacterium]|nr:TonB-dependent receptor [Acidobacteriota bacterium]
MSIRDLRSFFVVCLIGLLSASSAFPQAVNATLVGTVTDASGATVANAQVRITETNTGIGKTAQANESGNYTFPDLPPGKYSVTAEHPGFKKETRRDIEVVVNSNTRVDLQLTPGNVSETIEVTGAPPLLQTDRSDVGRSMDAQMVEDLPLGVNRNFQGLLDLVPGTTPANFEHSQFFNASSSLQTKVNGQPRMANSLQIEGIDNNQRTGLLQILIPPAEAIQTVSVSTSNHDPELGRGTGAITNVILRSGSNRFNGAVFEFIQNSALDARSYFNPTVGHLAYNQFGGRIGGPIKRNKLFFFADYQRTEDHEANTNQTTIPSVAFRNGDLSADRTHQVYDPATGDPATGAGRTPFPGNIIPASRINPISTKILSYLPPPNETFIESAPSNNYFALLPSRKTNDQVDTKIDYTISDKDRLSGRFSFARPVSFQAPIFDDAGGPAQGAFQGSGFQKTYSSGINYNRVISPTLLTEFRFGVAHYHNEARQSDYGKADTTALGIPNVNVNDFTSGFIGISIPNFSSPLTGYSASLPWIRAEANIDVVNSWTKILRNHTIKFGADLRRIRDDLLQDQTFSPRGVITFGPNQTATPGGGATGLANDMASFLLDVPTQVARDVNTYFPALRAWQIFSYAADNWQVSPKFTIQAGVRWELYPPPTPQFKGGFSNYDMANNRLIIAGIGDNPTNMGLKMNWGYVAPRIGVAYRLTEKTVIRSGFGMSYTPFPDNTWAYNYPVRANNQYNQLNGVSYLPAAYP